MNNLKRIIATGLVSLLLVPGIPGCKKTQDKSNVNIPKTEQAQSDTEQAQSENKLRSTVLSYLSQPKFSNSDFMEQITGTKAELKLLELGEGMVYLSVPKRHFSTEVLGELTLDPDSVEFGKTSRGEFSGNRVELGEYILKKPGNYFFRFPSESFRVDESDTINIPYSGVSYSIDMQELEGFLTNKSIFCGYLKAYLGINKSGRHQVIANHGAFVAKKGESSLTRLTNSLIGTESTKEGKAQKLLSFVTDKLKYDYSDAGLGVEVLKRPNEVLMTGGSDCSGKVILYASLLEQTNIDYRLVYVDKHITVAVEGDYPDRNGFSFNLGDKVFSIAEPTAEGFQIGRSGLSRDLSVDKINYLQKPGKNSEIYDSKTGKPLSFLCHR